MKQNPNLLILLLMAVVMMAMSPTKVWADETEPADPNKTVTTVNLSKDADGKYRYNFQASEYGVLTVTAKMASFASGTLTDPYKGGAQSSFTYDEATHTASITHVAYIDPLYTIELDGSSLDGNATLPITLTLEDLRPQLLSLDEGVTASFSRDLTYEWGYDATYNDGQGALTSKIDINKDVYFPQTTITFSSTENFTISFDMITGLSNDGLLYVRLDGKETKYYYNSSASSHVMHFDSGILERGKHRLSFDFPGLYNTNSPAYIYNIKALTTASCTEAHTYAEIVDDKYLKTAATCTSTAVYYRACSKCGVCESDDNHTFTAGGLGHVFQDGHIDGKCTKCGNTIPSYQGYEPDATGTADAIHWEIWANEDCETFTLKISGSGAMRDYDTWSGPKSPWYEKMYAGCKVTDIVVEQGITRLGNYAFYESKDVSFVSLPAGLLSIGECAFTSLSYNAQLDELVIPASVTTLDKSSISRANIKTIRFATGSQLSSIGTTAFQGPYSAEFGTDKIQNIIFTSSQKPTTIGENIFRYQTMLVSYPNTDEWDGFSDSQYGGTIKYNGQEPTSQEPESQTLPKKKSC